MKKKCWILGGILLAFAVSLCFFGVRLRLAPRWILSRSLSNAVTQLDTRFESSPVRLWEGVLSPKGQQKLELQVDTKHRNLGTVHYDMTVRTQLVPNRIQADGTIITGGKALDLSLYLDETFTAVSSDDLVAGNYYGITYDSFSKDIRSREILAALIGEKTITHWESSVNDLKERMSTDFTLPEFTAKDAKSALFGILALKPAVGTQEIVMDDGIRKVHTVSFRATGAEIVTAAEAYREELSEEILAFLDEMKADQEAIVEAKFFLWRGKLVKITGNLQRSAGNFGLELYLGDDPATKTIAGSLETPEGKYSFDIRTESDAETYSEVLHLVKSNESDKKSIILKYSWDLSSGDMTLKIHHEDQNIEQRLNLSREEDTLIIHSQDLSPIINLIREKDHIYPIIGTLKIKPGDPVETPAYRNLDQWSMEDLLALLSGFGGLIGINMS